MNHSLIGADRGTHCKILAVAAATTLLMLGLTAGVAQTETPTERSHTESLLLKIGKLGVSSIFDATAAN
jgi:hypothetical protein